MLNKFCDQVDYAIAKFISYFTITNFKSFFLFYDDSVKKMSFSLLCIVPHLAFFICEHSM